MPPNASFDSILSTTLKNHRGTLTDNVFSATPLFDRLRRGDRIRKLSGGATIVEPLLYAMNSTAKPYSGYDVLDLTPQEGITAAEFNWGQFATSVAISGREEAINNGREQIINLLKAKVMQAEMTTTEVMAEMIQGDGANFDGAPNAKTWNGLQNLVSATATVGGINPATGGNEFWRSVVLDGNSPAVTTMAAYEKLWATAYYTASRGEDRADMAVTTQTIFQAYEESLVPQLRFTSNNEADSRFKNLLWKDIPLFFDVYTAAGTTYLLNTKYLGLVVHSDRWLKNMPFREAPDVDARWSLILSMGQFTVRNRQRQAKVVNQDFA